MGRYKRLLKQWRSQVVGVAAGLVLAFVPIINGRALPWLSDVGNDSLSLNETTVAKTQVDVTPAKVPVWPASQLPNLFPAKTKKPVDCQAEACVALTFDDGPDPSTTPHIMAALEKYNVPATFFVIGNRVARNASLLHSMYQQGLEIGNHTWGHANLTKLTPEQVTQEINQTQAAFSSAGLPVPQLFRPPYGKRDEVVRERAAMPLIMWNVDPQDWRATEPAQVVQAVNAQAKPGSIILMHDTKPVTAAAAEEVVRDLQSHYQLVTVSQLLDLHSSSRGEYFSR